MIHYAEFDTTTQAVLADLRTEILKCADWSRIGAAEDIIGNITVATSAYNTSALTVASTTGMPVAVGSVVSVNDGPLRETRVVTGVTATQIQFGTPLAFAHAIGAPIRIGNQIFKATTTRGAQMVVDLAAGGLDFPQALGLSLAVYQSHDGTVGQGRQNKYVQWRYSNYNQVTPLHVILSLSKEHLFIAIEGPRPGETGAVHASYGSFRNYFFLSDLVPYDEEDVTPVVVSGGATMTSVMSSTANLSHQAHVSRNLENTGSWTPARLASLQVVSAGEPSVLNVQRQREIDDRYILTPYVVFADDDGMRGRLSSIFFAGVNQSSEFAVSPPPIGSRVQYQGLWYKLIAANKGDGARAAWGPLGMAANDTTTSFQRSVVVGVPCLP
jgi:hypothetical protein